MTNIRPRKKTPDYLINNWKYLPSPSEPSKYLIPLLIPSIIKTQMRWESPPEFLRAPPLRHSSSSFGSQHRSRHLKLIQIVVWKKSSNEACGSCNGYSWGSRCDERRTHKIDQDRCVPATAVVKVSISESTSGSVCSVLVERSRDLGRSVDWLVFAQGLSVR